MKSIELFAGAGGLALGVEAAGFENVALYEWNHNACDTLRRNRTQHGWEVVEGDVADQDFRPFRDEIDLVTGGPPCQPFSMGGKHKAQNDKRDMFPQAVRVVRDIRPKAFIFENVKGLTRRSFANYFSYIRLQFSYPTITAKRGEEWMSHLARLEALDSKCSFRGLTYKVIPRLFNSALYGAGPGVPQRRERVFFVGVRSDLGLEVNLPTEETHSVDALLHDQWVSNVYWHRHKLKVPTVPEKLARKVERLQDYNRDMLGTACRTVRDAISDLPNVGPGRRSRSIPNHFFNPGARSYAGHTGSPYDQPAKTLKAGDHGVPGGENTLQFADGSVRYFSIRECARLQTFPDDWIIEGSWTEGMRQLGNAVPVKLAQLVAESVAGTLKKAGNV
ncbi:DNA cytosine methyltransferase [Rhodopirellula halodulae]|uniref:DNA cytosine methyltransferase n=1 Tax=Rhodopirellula halodulae TaxID=2894198 RepID=UPI001E4286F7|nr:DNA (cytosine-5-)-methyltransferase [Rhodopirellula sp. JC737]MCC9655605.1 DNA cytosine methyltransferase [Rhodopirellula sp. JC737]